MAAGAQAAGAAQVRLPDFFIVGHPKCGTTALYYMLGRHPQVFMPEVKEPRFFASDLRSRFGPRVESVRRLQTFEGYASLFAGAAPGQRAGEASPEYLTSRTAARNIAEVAPEARIIAILREPASFLRSFHLQLVSSGVETERDLRAAMALEPARRAGKRIPRRAHRPQLLLYSDHLHYTEQLRRYHEAFGPERVLVLIYEEFRADNEATLRTVLRFLGVDETLPVETVQTKPVKAVRAMPLHRLAGALRVARTRPGAAGPLARAANALIPAPLRSEAARGAWRRAVYSQPPPPDEAFALELRRRFAPEVAALSEYLGRDLVSLWGYEGLG